MLDGLKGTATIVTTEGDEVATFDLPEQLGRGGSRPGDDLWLTMIQSFPVGRYTLRIDVTEPAVGLADMEQIISARYVLCGLEVMPAFLAGIIAVATAIPALIVGGFTLLGWKREGWRLRATTASDAIPGHEHA